MARTDSRLFAQLSRLARYFLLLDLSELFGVPYSPSQTMRVRATAPVQVMGVAVDAAGRATPIPVR